MVTIPATSLASNGETIPLVSFGTAEFPFNSSGSIEESALHAIKLGYRRFDTASLYESEQPVGKAIVQALRLGHIKSRDELFISSKLWVTDTQRDLVRPALQNTLKKLGLEYLDLYLIHFPGSLKPGTGFPFHTEDNLPNFDLDSVWEAMEECQRLGLTKSIGVCNFSCKKLEKLLAIAKIPPAVNQVEMNPAWQQKKLREFCEEKGIHITAYSPLGAKGNLWGSARVMESEVLKEIASNKGKTIAQISLRWVYEQGVSLVVKSFNKERMEENLGIFDWKLNPEELQKIEQIPQAKANVLESFVSENGPYKSIEEIWDGEI